MCRRRLHCLFLTWSTFPSAESLSVTLTTVYNIGKCQYICMPGSIVSGIHSDTICKIFFLLVFYFYSITPQILREEGNYFLRNGMVSFSHFLCVTVAKGSLLGGDFFNRAWLPWVSTTNRQQWWNRHFIELSWATRPQKFPSFLDFFFKSSLVNTFWQGVITTTSLLWFSLVTLAALIIHFLATFITTKLLSRRQCRSAIRPGKRRWWWQGNVSTSLCHENSEGRFSRESFVLLYFIDVLPLHRDTFTVPIGKVKIKPGIYHRLIWLGTSSNVFIC